MDTIDGPGDKFGMTDAQWEWFRQAVRGYGEQDENGTDLSLRRESLKMTPAERLRRHQQALGLVQEIQRAKRDAGRPRVRSHILELEALQKRAQESGANG